MDNVDTHRDAHEAFNRRDYDQVIVNFRDDMAFTDHPRGITTKSPSEFALWLKGWVETFSDATVGEPHYIDGGDHTVAVFQGRGTNDGPTGALPATGKRMDMPFCEILRYDAEGRVTGGELFYDTMTMMIQLGHMEPPPAE